MLRDLNSCDLCNSQLLGVKVIGFVNLHSNLAVPLFGISGAFTIHSEE
jgi:hypothetical protein